MTKQYTYLRQVEKRLIARLEMLGYPLGLTAKVLAKIIQMRSTMARKLKLRNI